jgi:uroporphyrinogen-III decarboxylase
MVRALAGLSPAVLHLGGSRALWDDAALVPEHVVLSGNLPSRRFHSDALVTEAQVERMAETLVQRMAQVGHPFILSTECDVLPLSGCEQTIQRKVDALNRVARRASVALKGHTR